MRPFGFTRAATVEAALAAHGEGASYLAGGTNLVDLMKEGVARPARLVDVEGLDLAAIAPGDDGGLSLGALARNAETAHHPLVRERAPLLSMAILAGASPQIRNMASNGGNLLQRTRCWYFYDTGTPCNKREPGSGCPAIGGLSKNLAILGTSEHCIATHPSDFCVALAALGAVVHVRAPGGGARTIAFDDFHRLPGIRPDLDTTLAPGELIERIEVPANGFAAHSTYLKVRERTSYAFALVAVAAALELDAGDGTVTRARIALGGVAAKPWRVPDAERLLEGRAPTETAFDHAAERLLDGAVARGDAETGNAYKIPLARRAIVRALGMARDGVPTNTGEDAHRAMAGHDEALA